MEAEDYEEYLRGRSSFCEQRCASRCGMSGAKKKWMWLFLDCSKCGTRRKLVVTTMGEGGPETAGHASTSCVLARSYHSPWIKVLLENFRYRVSGFNDSKFGKRKI